ncbi:MAG TPA: tyrosine-type recombinase/integrase [Pyrinomonadaceae bacterium]|nr:tyrosine-type recombinase/integrase [Pyrinomonadaceae bacterium]
MGPIVQEALLDLRDQAGDAEYVFTNPDTSTRYIDIKKPFSAACREAGITNFTFHDLHHTSGTRLADAGVDVVKIKELMGQSRAFRDVVPIGLRGESDSEGRLVPRLLFRLRILVFGFNQDR